MAVQEGRPASIAYIAFDIPLVDVNDMSIVMIDVFVIQAPGSAFTMPKCTLPTPLIFEGIIRGLGLGLPIGPHADSRELDFDNATFAFNAATQESTLLRRRR